MLLKDTIRTVVKAQRTEILERTQESRKKYEKKFHHANIDIRVSPRS